MRSNCEWVRKLGNEELKTQRHGDHRGKRPRHVSLECPQWPAVVAHTRVTASTDRQVEFIHEVATGGYVYHALNRAVGRSTISEKAGDYAAFEQVLQEARIRSICGSWTFVSCPTIGQNWLEYVNQAETEAELTALRRSAHVGTPYGQTIWQQATAKRLGLESTLRTPGRPPRRSDRQ